MKYLKMVGLSAFAVSALIVFAGAGTASATTLEVNGTTQSSNVTISASLEKGTSALLKDSLGTTTDTCTASTVHGTTTVFTGTTVSGPIQSLTFSGCSHTTDVLAAGSLSIDRIENTTNGTVTSSGAEVQVKSTFFGITATCKTGAGTDIGTLTGKPTGLQATMDINATIDCGSLGNSSWTGSYLVTSPSGLGVVG